MLPVNTVFPFKCNNALGLCVLLHHNVHMLFCIYKIEYIDSML